MQVKFYSRLQAGLLLSTGLFLGLATLTPQSEAALTMNGQALNGVTVNGITLNGVTINGIRFNGVRFNGALLNSTTLSVQRGSDLPAASQLRLEGSQLVLRLNR